LSLEGRSGQIGILLEFQGNALALAGIESTKKI